MSQAPQHDRSSANTRVICDGYSVAHQCRFTSTVHCCFTSTETVRIIRDGEPRAAISTFSRLLSAPVPSTVCFVHQSAVRSIIAADYQMSWTMAVEESRSAGLSAWSVAMSPARPWGLGAGGGWGGGIRGLEGGFGRRWVVVEGKWWWWSVIVHYVVLFCCCSCFF